MRCGWSTVTVVSFRLALTELRLVSAKWQDGDFRWWRLVLDDIELALV